MESQKVVSILNDTANGFWKFATQKSYVTNGENDNEYGVGNVNDSTIKFETKVFK